MGWDRSLFWQINRVSAATGWAHGVVSAYALWGGLAVLVLTLGCAWWWTARRRRDGYRSVAAVPLIGVAAVLALGLNQILGPAVHRTRPFAAMPHVLVLLSRATDSSFPSDHAMIAGALAAGLMLVSRAWGFLAVGLALFLAFARVYCGVHYPSDVLAGLVIGAAVAVIVVAGLRGALARLLAPVADTALRPLLTTVPRPVSGAGLAGRAR